MCSCGDKEDMSKDNDDKIDIFSGRTSDWWNNACLNFTYGENAWLGYSTVYKRGASIRAACVDSQQQCQDALIFPMLFLYRHYIELVFKQILKNCAAIMKNTLTFKTYNLKVYWELAKVNVPRCVGESLVFRSSHI
jgi:hypothetical protein